MIDKKQLQFDNWVKIRGQYTVQVKGMFTDWFTYNETNACKYEDAVYIPLTAEMLVVNFGFVKGTYHTNWFSHSDLSCHIVMLDDCCVMEMVDDIRVTEPFNYVHELQNIFYWMSKKELIYNPEKK